MRAELRKLLDKVKITAIFVTHDQEEALTMSDKIAVMDQGRVIQFGTPMEVYDKPHTSFVASFVGNSNLFGGVVRRREDGELTFESDGLALPLPADLDVTPGDTITLLIRPEHLILRPIAEAAQCQGPAVSGTVAFVTHFGMAIQYEVKLDTGAQLRVELARSRGQDALAVGTRVCLESADSQSYLRLPMSN